MVKRFSLLPACLAPILPSTNLVKRFTLFPACLALFRRVWAGQGETARKAGSLFDRMEPAPSHPYIVLSKLT